MSKLKFMDWIWPQIMDSMSAKKASRQGMWAAVYCAGVTIIFVILSLFGVQMFDFDTSALLDASLFSIIAWGIFRLSRVASVAGLSLYILERLYMWSVHGPKNPAMALFITVMFINSVRGTFAYYKLKESESVQVLTE